jgi:glycosyltransferase involved in cell wall biosynthesis
VLSENDIIYPKEKPYKLCTFSRVMREKGIEDAIEAVKKINSERNEIVCTLDIYGQIDKEYEERFQQLTKEFPDFISYKGLVDFDKSTEVLKNYFALSFPTYYEGEGFPGTVLDAFSSGIPVIATNWKYNSEVIRHGKVGYIYECGSENLALILKKILENPDSISQMKTNCLLEAKKYDTKTVVQLFLTQMKSA